MPATTWTALSACAKAFQGYNQLHLLSALGALQVIPQNIHLTSSVELLTSVAVTLPRTAAGKRQTTRDHLIAILVRHPALRQSQPAFGAFTEAVAFLGGSYTIFTAGTDDLGVVLRQTLNALFLNSEPLDDAEFMAEARDLLWAALILSDEVARRAGVRRNTLPPVEARSRRLVFPDDALRQAVIFDEADLHALLAPSDLKPDVLDCLTLSPGGVSLRDVANGQHDAHLRPLIRLGTKRVVALPGQLLNSARHEVQRRAIERGAKDRLAALLHRAAASSTQCSVARLGAMQIDYPVPDPIQSDLCSEFLFRIDADKVLFVLLVTDTLDGFDPKTKFKSWTLAATLEQLKARFAAATAHICHAEPALSDTLCLLVLQGPLGWAEQSYWPALPECMPGLVVSTHELDTVSWLERGEPLALWHFAENAGRVRQRGPVYHRFLLDEWAMSKRAEHGDYAPVQSHAKPIPAEPGGAARLRGEVLQRWDLHGAPFLGRETGVEVVRAGGEGSAVYTLCDTPLPVTRLVEGMPLPFWVVGVVHADEWDEKLHDAYHMITSVVAFWIDELCRDLEAPLSSVAPHLSQVTVRVLLEPADAWLELPEELPEQAPYRVNVTPEEGIVDLVMWSDARVLFFRPDNQGERALLTVLLDGLARLLPEGRRDCLSADVIQELIDRHAPVGPKKAASILNVPNAPMLDPRGIPPYRGIQRRDELNIKAEIGRHSIEALEYPVGILSHDQSNPLMMEIVSFLFQRLQQEVATLNPNGLLEWLMAHDEANVRQQEQIRVTAPSRLRIASDSSHEEQLIHGELSDLSRAARSLRFLIEYVAAQPPGGLRPVSYGVFDYLLALAAQIIDWGETCDLQRAKLAIPELVIHPFGRVGISTKAFDQVRQRYYAVFAGHAVANMEETFADHWAPMEEVKLDPNHPPFEEEMGEQLRDMFLLLGHILPIGDQISPGIVCMSIDQVAAELARVLGWSEFRTRQRVADLSLAPRADFLKPGTHPSDQVYPWFAHRALSYLRRPLVQRVRNGSTEILWGSRHVTAVVPYLWTSFCTQRLKDMDEQTTRLMGKAADKSGFAFNQDVAKLLTAYPHLTVIPGFKKVKGLQMNMKVGDVDVLVIEPVGRRILAIECKQLARAHSPQELRWELDRLYLGHDSRVARHLRRIQWLTTHWQQFLAELHLDPSTEWKLEPLMVVDAELFAPHFQQPPFPVLALRELPRWLASEGVVSP